MAGLSPSARALRDLQRAIHRHGGKDLGDVARRAVREHADDPDTNDHELTCWIWGYIYSEAPPEVFVRPVDDEHHAISTATLYTLRSARDLIAPVPFTAAERRALSRARAVVAENGGLSDLRTRRWRHLVGLKGSPLDLTFQAGLPDAGGAALCWEPGLEQTAVYPHDILEFKRSLYGPSQVVPIFVHEEVHLALSLRARTRSIHLSPVCRAALELAADAGEAIAFGLVKEDERLPSVAEVIEYLCDRATSRILALLPKSSSTAEALQAMVALSAAAQRSEDALLGVARLRLARSVSQRRLESLLGLD